MHNDFTAASLTNEPIMEGRRGAFIPFLRAFANIKTPLRIINGISD